MMFSLNVNSIRDVLKRRGKNAVTVVDLPKYTHDHLGLGAINLSTDLLKGMGRSQIEQIRDNGDKVGCTCLLLSEPEPLDLASLRESNGDKAVERMSRVIRAASVLGCNAASLSINAPDNADSMELAVERMKRVLEVADSIDINVLIAPISGLTEDPDRVIQLVKAIGGFRIGTLPDFASAVGSGDPVNYLRRLTPYASVVNATTMGFVEPEPSENKPVQSPQGLSGLDALAAELDAMEDDLVPVHQGYAIEPLVGAMKAIGFDGNLALDFRGSSDGTLGVLQSRDAIEAALIAVAES